MSLISHPVVIKFRGLTRRLGFNSFLGKLLGTAGYEIRLQHAMQQAIKEGDCVWDVGANIGWYTLQFANWVGAGGQVIAFEPDPKNAGLLNKAVEGLPNISVATIGLSNEGGHAAFQRGKDQFGTTSMIVRELTGDEPQTIVVVSGDEIIAKNDARAPNLIKIDVEGHELEVLEGMTATLKRPELRELFVEVHFAVLEEQGRRHVPSAIEGLLMSSGFKLTWVDPSHLHATR
jgi:FkbM family methyltransferase